MLWSGLGSIALGCAFASINIVVLSLRKKNPKTYLVFSFIEHMLNLSDNNFFLIHTEGGKQFKYRIYYNSYFNSIIDNFNWIGYLTVASILKFHC